MVDQVVEEIATKSLDGAQDVLLAPVRGLDDRRRLPKELFERKPSRFTLKFSFALALIGAAYAVIALGLGWAFTVPAAVALGLMYAHLVELQHECLHEHAYRRRFLNRAVGFMCGLFMLSSYSHYKYDHLRHHASLGRPDNREFFNYRFRHVDSPLGFVRAAYHLGRYVDVFRAIAFSLVGKPIPNVKKGRDQKRIRTEYWLFFLFLAGMVAYSAVTLNPLFLVGWALPVLLISEPTHFVIELPEHFGLDTQTDANVLTNTRTIDASRLAEWFTNYNNLHTAHHYHQGVPMVNVPRLSEREKPKFAAVERSYWSFYRKVIRGEIRYDDLGATCMTR
jgi:fatty acid desaturase